MPSVYCSSQPSMCNGSGDDKQGHPEAAPSGLRLSALILPGQRYPALPADVAGRFPGR